MGHKNSVVVDTGKDKKKFTRVRTTETTTTIADVKAEREELQRQARMLTDRLSRINTSIAELDALVETAKSSGVEE